MRHAILIMGHKNLAHISRLVAYFERDCDVFLLLDHKGHYNSEDLERLRNSSRVRSVTTAFTVNWGGTSVLEGELRLVREAYFSDKYDYFHLLSGQDYPIRPLDRFLDFFEKNEGKEFLQYVHLPHPVWERNSFRRLQYFYPYDQAATKSNPREWVREQVRKQCRKGVKRPIPMEFDHLYGSSQWFTLSHHAVHTLINYTDQHPSLYHRMRMVFAPEECYVATVVVNLLGKEHIAPTNLRYIRWKHENGNCPANLDTNHFHSLVEQDNFFARKIERGVSDKLLSLIDCYLLRNAQKTTLQSGGWIYDGYLDYTFDQRYCDFVARLYREVGARTALDIGCGAGLYVGQWRRWGLSFAGYDANPHTPALSRLLISEGDEPCGVADLSEQLNIDAPFDLVICKDVLPYIPATHLQKAIHNLAALTSHLLLVSWPLSSDGIGADVQWFTSSFVKDGFVLERYTTARMRVMFRNYSCFAFIRRGHQLMVP